MCEWEKEQDAHEIDVPGRLDAHTKGISMTMLGHFLTPRGVLEFKTPKLMHWRYDLLDNGLFVFPRGRVESKGTGQDTFGSHSG